ncbi:MAG: hypothetical protein J5I52_00400 [Saprospiraceae bacterium]|nr:hypothetical protein [Saprospiraceae bacterium]
MKSNRPKKSFKKDHFEEGENFPQKAPKKKMAPADSKVNLKSKKFWKDIYEEEEDEIERFIRKS